MGLMRFWATRVAAPWCLATGLLVSFAADAGQESSMGLTFRDISGRATPRDLVPSVGGRMAVAFHSEATALAGLITPASLTIGTEEEFRQVPDEEEPRVAMKRHVAALPIVDRAHKGNLFLGLRPSYQSKATQPQTIGDMRRAAAVFGHDARNPTPTVLLQAEGDPPGPEAVAAFEGAVLDPTTTAKATSLASPQATASVPTVRAALTQAQAAGPSSAMPSSVAHVAGIVTVRGQDGSSAIVPRAVGLASMTPTAADAVPVEVEPMLRLPGRINAEASRPGGLNTSIIASNGQIVEQPDYLSLISAANLKPEEQCLAEAIYFEARSEPELGQAAVAQVVLNRVASGLYPQTVCGVVYQNRQHYMACQFSFACEGKSLSVTEPAPWATAQRIAKQVLDGQTYMAKVGGATHYHAKYVRPYWASSLTKMDTIGQHIFYKMKGGQL